MIRLLARAASATSISLIGAAMLLAGCNNRGSTSGGQPAPTLYAFFGSILSAATNALLIIAPTPSRAGRLTAGAAAGSPRGWRCSPGR